MSENTPDALGDTILWIIIVILMLAVLGMFAAIVLPQPVRAQTAHERAVCLPEVRRLCPEASHDLRSEVECLVRNRSMISISCRKALAAHGL